MAHYRKVDTRIWNDEKFCSLSPMGKLAFFFILTHPNMTSLGAMRGTRKGLAYDLDEVLPEAFDEVFQKAFVKDDPKAKIIVINNFLKYNPPESPNVVKSWKKASELIPECDMKRELIQHVKDFLEGYSKGFKEAFAEGFAESGAGAGAEYKKKNIQKKKPKKQLRKTSIPKDYSLTDRHIHYADSKGMSYEIIKHEFEGFCIYHRQKGSKFVDWYAAWQTWVRNYFTFGKDQNEKTAMASNNLPEVTGSLYAN